MADYGNCCHDVCSSIVDSECAKQISGAGLTDEVDHDAKFGKWKYHRRQIVDPRLFSVPVYKSDSLTLIALIKTYV